MSEEGAKEEACDCGVCRVRKALTGEEGTFVPDAAGVLGAVLAVVLSRYGDIETALFLQDVCNRRNEYIAQRGGNLARLPVEGHA